MKVVIQRVSKASCTIDEKITGEINTGYLLLVGFGPNDNEQIANKLAEKIAKLRVFEDEEGKMNKSIFEVSGSILSISQFTLYADCKKGNRPSFSGALSPEEAQRLYLYFNDCLRKLGLNVQEGVFAADMKISLLNDGPVTIVLDSEEL